MLAVLFSLSVKSVTLTATELQNDNNNTLRVALKALLI